jgi:hypothetical protein
MSLYLKLLAEGVALGAPLVLLVSYLMAKLLVREPPDLHALFRRKRRRVPLKADHIVINKVVVDANLIIGTVQNHPLFLSAPPVSWTDATVSSSSPRQLAA